MTAHNFTVQIHKQGVAQPDVVQLQPKTSSDATPVRLAAQQDVKYQFIDNATGEAPQQLTATRKGNDLHLSFSDKPEQADLIIEGFYNYPAGSQILVGGNEGTFTAYTPATTTEAISYLNDGSMSTLMLANDQVATWSASTLLTAAGALLFAGVAISSGDDDKGHNGNVNASLKEDNQFAGNLPSNPELTKAVYALGTQAKNGKVTVNADGSYSYVPNANFHGTDSFTYSVSDGKGGSNTYTVSLTVNPVNDAPTAANSSQTLNEDKTLSGKLPAATDVDGDKVSYALGAQAKNGTATVNADGSYSYVPNANFHGTDSFTYSVSDGKGGSNFYTVSLTVNPVNDAPTAANSSQTLNEDKTLSGKLPAATDVDGDKVSYALGKQAVNGKATVNADGSYSYTPNANFHGTDSFTYSVSDGKGGSNFYTVSLTVNPVNDAPTAADSSNSLKEDSSISGKLPAAFDIEGDKISYALSKQPANGKATVNADGSYSYTPNAKYYGADSFSYTVSDDQGGSNTYTVSLTVEPLNKAPVAANAQKSLDEDSALAGQLPRATDAEGDKISYALGAQAANGKATVNADGSYSYTPNANYHGTDSFTYSVKDDKGNSNTYTVSLTVAPVNDAPLAANTSNKLNQNSTLTGKLPTASDIDGDKIDYILDTQAENGKAIVNIDGSYSYTPNANFYGTDSFTYSVIDGKGGANTYTVSLNINAIPVAANASNTLNEDTPITGNLPPATDADGDKVTYALETDASNGSVTVNADGSYSYAPYTNFHGSDSFTYSVNDGKGGTNSYVVDLTIESVNDAPISFGLIAKSSSTSSINGVISGYISGALSAYDPEGDPISWKVVTQPSQGILQLNNDGSFTYQVRGLYGGASFDYEISDSMNSNVYTQILI